MGDSYMSREGYQKLIRELEKLHVLKNELSLEIGETREQGDLRENAGYQYAREKQADTLRRIGEIQGRMSGAKIIEDLDLPKDQVIIGMKVTIQDQSDKEKYEYTLVGADETDPENGKISVHAPIAQGLLGHKKDDVVDVELPSGKIKFKILKIVPTF